MGTKENPVLYFDRYRLGYDAMTFAEQRAWHDELARRYPQQIGFSLPLARAFMDLVEPASVIELGGWDGRMAWLVGARVGSWVNYELADIPQVCRRPGYEMRLDRYAWEDAPLVADAFVAAHALEHLSTEHLLLLLDALDCPWAYVEVPLGSKASDWRGYFGSHVLPLSIAEFDRAWGERGWEMAYMTQTPLSYVRFYRR